MTTEDHDDPDATRSGEEGSTAMAELSQEVLDSVSTPDHVDSRLGQLEFTDGAPSAKTVETLYDHLDFFHALNGFLSSFQAASTQAIREGFHGIGVEDNSVLIFSELMDSSSRFLTANADTVYYIAFFDLSDGPDGRGDAARCPGHVRRHVVPVDHRLRAAGTGPWRRREVPAGAPGLRRPAARRRVLRRALAHEPGAHARPVVHGRQRPGAHRRDHQVDAQGLSLRAWAARAPAWPPSSAARSGCRRRHRHLLQTTSSREAVWRSTRSRPTTAGSSRPCTPWCRTRSSVPPTPRSSATWPRSAS